MSMIFPQNTLSKKMRTPLLLACFALTVVGCSRNEQKDEQTGSAASSEQQPIETSDIACNNEKATNAIHSYLADAIDQITVNGTSCLLIVTGNIRRFNWLLLTTGSTASLLVFLLIATTSHDG